MTRGRTKKLQNGEGERELKPGELPKVAFRDAEARLAEMERVARVGLREGSSRVRVMRHVQEKSSELA